MEDEEVFHGNMDELIAKMEADELEGAPYLTPRDFAKMVGDSPQLVYYHIRQKHIKKTRCVCGRTVINVEEAKAFWETLKKGKKDV